VNLEETKRNREDIKEEDYFFSVPQSLCMCSGGINMPRVMSTAPTGSNIIPITKKDEPIVPPFCFIHIPVKNRINPTASKPEPSFKNAPLFISPHFVKVTYNIYQMMLKLNYLSAICTFYTVHCTLFTVWFFSIFDLCRRDCYHLLKCWWCIGCTPWVQAPVPTGR